MAGKTPLELAQRILARKEDDVCAQCEPDCMCSEREARLVAAAYVERMDLVAQETERCARIARDVSAEYPTEKGLQRIGSWIVACDEIEERIKKPVS